MQAWFFLIGPLLLGAYGLTLLFNIFGATSDLEKFYKGRADWYPILQGDSKGTHRLAGAALTITAIVMTVAFWRMNIL